MGPSTLEEALIGQVALDHTLPVGFLATACSFPFLHNVAPERSHQNPSWFSAFLQEHHHRKTNNNKKPATVSPSCYKVYQLLVAGKGGYADFRQTATAFRVPTSPKN